MSLFLALSSGGSLSGSLARRLGADVTKAAATVGSESASGGKWVMVCHLWLSLEVVCVVKLYVFDVVETFV